MMLDFQQKRKVRGWMYSKATIVVLFFILVIVLHSTWVVYRKKVESENMKVISEKNVDALRSRSTDLQYKIDRLATQQGIEEEVRSKFSVAKDNENIVVIVQEESSTSESVKTSSFWNKIKGFLYR